MPQPKTQQKKALITNTVSEAALLDMVAEGWTHRKIAAHVEQLTGQPVSCYYVTKTLQSFGDRYTEAKRAQAEMHANKLAEISDRVEEGTLDPASARVSSDNRKWLASKLNPSEYSDRAQLDVAITDVTQLHLHALRERLKVVGTQAKGE
jgi:hypothetical protein